MWEPEHNWHDPSTSEEEGGSRAKQINGHFMRGGRFGARWQGGPLLLFTAVGLVSAIPK